MTITDLFRYLGAPLANQRWSWGSVRPTDGAVFLRVWQDESRKLEQGSYSQITFAEFFRANPSNVGYVERTKHVELIRAGAPSFMVMCVAADPKANPRKIARIDRNDVFVGGALRDVDGDWWLERTERRPIAAVRPPPKFSPIGAER